MYSMLRSLLFRLSPELAHKVVLHTLSLFPSTTRLMARRFEAPKNLSQQVMGFTFPHPVGLAAGLDKDGIAINGLLDCGFSFIEVGTVTPVPQTGNPQPRLFRLKEDEALVNRMGFNNSGAAALKRHLMRRRRRGIIGINFGKNKVTPNESAVEDYLLLMSQLYSSADYIVLNVSSPNTPGLRDLQSEAALVPLVKRVLEKRNELFQSETTKIKPHCPPVFVKIAPDLSNEAILSLAHHLQDCGIDGFIATNTTISRERLLSAEQHETGGLSGRPLRERSTEVIRLLYSVTKGSTPIIGCGGIFTADDAYEKMRAGANLIQIYTGFIYKGPAVIREIVSGLSDRIRKDGYQSISEVIGIDA